MARKSPSFFCRLCWSSSIRRAAGGTRWALSSVLSLGAPPTHPGRWAAPPHCCCRRGAPVPRGTRASAAAPDLLHAASACRWGARGSLSSRPFLCFPEVFLLTSPPDSKPGGYMSQHHHLFSHQSHNPPWPLSGGPWTRPPSPICPLLSIPQPTCWSRHHHPLPAFYSQLLSSILHPAARDLSRMQISSNERKYKLIVCILPPGAKPQRSL